MIIGIDLGTTTSEIAYLKNGKPEIIINKDGDRITPSVVALNRDNVLIVGKKAKRNAIPERTLLEVKRKMGSAEMLEMGDKKYLPQQISAMILKYLKESAEEHLGEIVTEAVITVPAMFDNLQRQATKDAAEIAGLKVERIINEPTAAALAYGLENIGKDEKVLVYDLGGGTFDVTILEMYEGIMDVKVSRGNNSLGGKDFDEQIMQYIFDDVFRKLEIDLRKNKAAVSKIKEAAEIAKIDLSSSETANINIPFIPSFMNSDGTPIGLEMEITRKQFEMLIADLVSSTETLVEEALKACKLSVDDINAVLAVGGSTRVPCIKSLLKKKFGDKLMTGINPDEVVAMGAAIQAGIKSGEFKSENEILITDVCQYSMGISVVMEVGGRYMSGIFDALISKDTTIPITQKNVYRTTYDNQDVVNIEVFQGEETLVINNTKIGEFHIDGIPKSPAGEQGIEVSFSYDINGILKVDTTILSTGSKKSEIFNLKSMSSEQIEASKVDLDSSWQSSALANRVKILIETAERLMGGIDQKEKIKIELLLADLKKALMKEDENQVDKLDTELTDMLFDLK